jgi:hypothetical protein
LRLNGFLLLENFLVHGDRGGDTRTDIDVLGVRFRYRKEHLIRPMKDDAWIEAAGRSIVVFCEAKRGPEDLNPSWANRDRKIIESFLALVGAVPPACQKQVADELYATGQSGSIDGFLITTLLMNHDPNQLVQQRWSTAPRVSLGDALSFIHGRLRAYEKIKMDHGQWPQSGVSLWGKYSSAKGSKEEFIAGVLGEIGVAHD